MKGDQLRLFHQIKALSKEYKVHLISLSEVPISEAELDQLRPYCEEISIFHISKWASYWRVMNRNWLEAPAQVQYFWRPALKRKIAQQIHSIDPDVVYCQLMRMVPYVTDLPYPVVLDYMDAFSHIAEKRASVQKGIKSYFWKNESRTMRMCEQDVMDQFQGHLAISERDARFFQQADKKPTIVPNGIDTDYFSPSAESASFDLCFVGNLTYFPNVGAVEYLKKYIMPLVWKKHPSATLLIAGYRPSNQLKRTSDNRITIWDSPEEINTAYRAAKIFVAPIFEGGGMQNKILEAASTGLAIVCTEHVAKGLGELADIVFAGENYETMTSKIGFLLDHKDELDSTRKNMREIAVATYSWARANESLLEVFKNTKRS